MYSKKVTNVHNILTIVTAQFQNVGRVLLVDKPSPNRSKSTTHHSYISLKNNYILFTIYYSIFIKF